MSFKQILGGALLAGALVVGLLLGYLLPIFSPKPATPAWNTSTLLVRVQGLSELSTVKYVLEKVVILEDVKWYGGNRVILLAHGVVKAGVDLSQLKPGDIEIRGKELSINLPRAQISDVYLDESLSQVVEHSSGLIRRLDSALEREARIRAIEDIRRAARNQGIASEAAANAARHLTLLFQQLGFERVTVQTNP
jgi:hypothetical protein